VGNKSQTPAALEPFMRALDKSCSGDVSKVRQRLIAITDADGALRQRVDDMGCENVFPYPELGQEDLGIGFTCFSSLGLVPAALMGVNVIELLLGAVATNKHFEQAKPDSNCILQYVAVNRLLAEIRGVRNRVLSLQNKSLESVGEWYQHLLESAASDRLLPCRVTHRSKFIEGDSRQLPFREGSRGMPLSLFHHLIVEEPRFDPLGTNQDVWAPNLADETEPKPIVERQVSPPTFPELLRLAFEKETKLNRLQGMPSTSLFIPNLDELHLGQLLQMLMVSTRIERSIRNAEADEIPVYGDAGSR
jgi:glucose-6-phosphate isomerase